MVLQKAHILLSLGQGGKLPGVRNGVGDDTARSF